MNEQKTPLNDLMSTTLEKLKAMIDTDTIVGKPIETPDGVTLIPVTQLSMGFGTGGADFSTKNQKPDGPNSFGGGSGAGVRIDPVAFLVVRGDSVRLLPVGMPPMGPIDRAIDMVPEVVDKITAYLDRQKADKSEF